MSKTLSIFTASLLMISMMTCQAAYAAYVPSNQAFTSTQTEQYRADIASALDKQVFQEALKAQGVSADEVKARLSMLSPSQIEQLKTQLDTIPAGEGAFGVAVGAAVFIFVVLLITDIVGATDVFDFDKH